MFPRKHLCGALNCGILMLVAIFASCSQSVGEKSGKPSDGQLSVESRATLYIGQLSPDFLKPVGTSSPSAASNELATRKSLKLDGTTLIVGPVGAHQTATLVANTLILSNGARIVTNGNDLSLVANVLQFDANGGINSFSDGTSKAGMGQPGSDGGVVDIYVLKRVAGSVQVSLEGQIGGDGAKGAKGPPGSQGARGSNGVDSAFGCKSGGQDGAKGGPGGVGSPGNPGQPGGSGGELILRGEAAKNHQQHFVFRAPPGAGGTGGAGGDPGDGGPGGEGGSGTAFCGGGHGGQQGDQGKQGDPGKNGSNGVSDGKLTLK